MKVECKLSIRSISYLYTYLSGEKHSPALWNGFFLQAFGEFSPASESRTASAMASWQAWAELSQGRRENPWMVERPKGLS